MSDPRPGIAERTTLLAAALLFLAFTAMIALDPGPTRLDQGASDALRRLDPAGAHEWGDEPIERSVDPALFRLAGLALVLLVWRRGAGRVALGIAALLASTEILVALLKVGLARPRPPGAFATSGSFPSGHVATFATTLGAWLLIGLPLLRPGFRGPYASGRAALAALVALLAYAAFRLSSGEHWATDVLASVFLGTAAATGGVLLLRRIADPATARIQPSSLKGPPAVQRP